MAVWYSLFHAVPGAGAAAFRSQCARFIDANFYRDATGVSSNSLKAGEGLSVIVFSAGPLQESRVLSLVR